MNVFGGIYNRFRFFFIALSKVGDLLHALFESITNSKWGKFFLKWRLFTLIPILGLTYTVNSLRGQKDALKNEIADVRVENNVLKEQVMDCFRTFNDIPTPIWSKLKIGEDGYLMLRVNDTYYFVVMKPMGYGRTSYVGKKDDDIYTKEIAKLFRTEDDFVAITGDTLVTLNRLRDSVNNLNKDFIIIKWRKIEKNKDTLILGQAIDVGNLIKDLELKLKK